MSSIPLHVLLVIADPDARLSYRHLLTNRDRTRWRVTEARTATDALAMVPTDKPDCILLAAELPDASGLELLRRMPRGVVWPVAVVMVGEDADEEAAATTLASGAQDYLDRRRITGEGLERALSNAVRRVTLLSALELERRRLMQANRTLEQRTREIRRFHHAMSHELRTPLSAVRELLAVVLENPESGLTEPDRRCLELARQACDQLTLSVRDLVDATRAETGKLAVSIGSGRIEHVVARVLQTFNHQAEQAGIYLHQELQPGLPAVAIDEPRIVQVLTNLLENAIKFTPAGGTIRVGVESSPGHPEVVTLSVRDTGCGIPREALRRVFEPYYQVETPQARAGLGLGLSICREIVHQHGGTIWVESAPGKGSTFSMTLRAAESNPSVSGETLKNTKGAAA